jgi:hypothetical protein
MKLRTAVLQSLATALALAPSLAISNQCMDGQGTWQDRSYGGQWILGQSGFNVLSGYVTSTYVWNSYTLEWEYSDPCIGPFWPVTGSIDAGQVTLTATNPYPPSEYCTRAFTYRGTHTKPGCHFGRGTWTNLSGYSGTWLYDKPCEMPASETTLPTAGELNWGNGLGYKTVHVWTGVLSPAGINFVGRNVGERALDAGVDSCHWVGSTVPGPVTGVSGTSAPVQPGNIFGDAVGWSEDAVRWYRLEGRAPCSYVVTQAATLDCRYEWRDIAVNVLGHGLTATAVWSRRGNQYAEIPWPAQ